jgi:hypothetical protein
MWVRDGETFLGDLIQRAKPAEVEDLKRSFFQVELICDPAGDK